MSGFVLLLYGPSLFGGWLVGGADVVRSAYPIRHHFWSIVQRGELPTWSPYLMGGYPIIVEEQASPFYPPEWVFGLFRTPAAYNFIIGFHAWVAGLGAYLLARKLGLSRLAAWMVVAVAILGAPLSARVAAGHPSHFYGRALMLWALVAILYLAERPGWWSAVGLAAVFGAQLLIGIGNYQTALYTILLAILFGAFVFWGKVAPHQRRRFLAFALLAAVLATGLGAARAAPTLEIGLQSSRQEGLSPQSLNYGALPPIMLFGYFLPHAFDDPSISDYTWPEFALYVGSAPALLALYGSLKRRREPGVRFWMAVTLLFLLLSLGDQGGLFPSFVRFVPGYQFFRNPARHGMVTSLGVMLLAGYGLDRLSLAFDRPRQRKLAWRIGLAAGLLALAVLATYQEPVGSSFELLPLRVLRGALWFVMAGIVFLLAVRSADRLATPRTGFLVVGVVAFDLLLYALPQIYQGSRPAELPYVQPHNFPGGLEYSLAYLETGNVDDWGLVNAAADNGVRLLNMYTGVVPLRMNRLVNVLTGRPASAPQEENLILLDQIARPDLLDYLGVRYLLVAPDHGPIPDPSLRETEHLEHLRVLENTDAMPFAFVVPEVSTVPSSQAALKSVQESPDLRMEPAWIEGPLTEAEHECPGRAIGTDRLSNLRLEGGRIRFEFEASQAGMLLVNQTFQKGWRAWVNRAPTPVYAVDYRWVGLHLPCSGSYQIDLRYLPLSLTVGLAVSSITLLSVAATSIIVARRSNENDPESASVSQG